MQIQETASVSDTLLGIVKRVIIEWKRNASI